MGGPPCNPAAYCTSPANTPCQPTFGGRGIPIPGASPPNNATPELEIAGALALVVAGGACVAGVRYASLLAVLGAAALAYVLVTTRTLAWWAWAAAALAALACLMGPRSVAALSDLDAFAHAV